MRPAVSADGSIDTYLSKMYSDSVIFPMDSYDDSLSSDHQGSSYDSTPTSVMSEFIDFDTIMPPLFSGHDV